MSRHRTVSRSGRPLRAAFTLIEAMVATAITAIAGSALLLGITSSLQTTTDALEQQIASGMAQQLMDEVCGARYCELGVDGYQTSFGPSTYESSGSGRERFDDIADYDGLRVQPAEDLWGVELGSEDGQGGVRHPGFRAPAGFLDNWRQEVDVYYVSPADPSQKLPGGQVSDYRAVEVRISYVDPERGTRELTQLRRVVAYVPPLP